MSHQLLFVWDHEYPEIIKDGLIASINSLYMKGTGLVHWYNISKDNLPDTLNIDDFDFILGWGAFGSKADRFISNLVCRGKKGLCLAGNATPVPSFIPYDVIFYETEWVRNHYLKDVKCRLIHAFGYNEYVYKDLNIERDVDYLGVGSFSLWKRWEKMLSKKGVRRVIGEMQKGNPAESEVIWSKLEENGILCKDMIPANELNLEYNRAKTVYIPANIIGGGERAILEARACGCKVEVEPDNPKLKELLTCPLWDTNYYTDQLIKGILC